MLTEKQFYKRYRLYLEECFAEKPEKYGFEEPEEWEIEEGWNSYQKTPQDFTFLEDE